MRLVFLAAIALAAPAWADVMSSGLVDPLENAAACEAFAYGVETSARDPILDAIAFMDARIKYGLFHDHDAEFATDLLNARADGTLQMVDEDIAIFVRRVCRTL